MYRDSSDNDRHNSFLESSGEKMMSMYKNDCLVIGALYTLESETKLPETLETRA